MRTPAERCASPNGGGVACLTPVGARVQDALQLSLEKKRRIVENRRQLLLNLEQLLRKQNMVRHYPESAYPQLILIASPLPIVTVPSVHI